MCGKGLISVNISEQLEKDGVVVLPGLLAGETLRSMQLAFASRLRRLRWNDVDGYEKTERFRHMVQNVLQLEQGFVDAAVHPLVTDALRSYIGPKFALVEAKGWKSLPTRRLFHGWHADAWYDQSVVATIPREVKLAFYLSDVRTGAFEYIRGTHRKQHPRIWRGHEISAFPAANIQRVAGPAGTAFLFDTSGIHRHSSPILEPRQAVFYNYHDPSVKLQREDLEYDRYHPLLLNAALLGGLSEEDRRILGFGDKTNYQPLFERKPLHKTLQAVQSCVFDGKILAGEFTGRVIARLRHTFRVGR